MAWNSGRNFKDMNKQEAADKLINMFGNVNIVGVLHSVLVETSRYIIIILFAIYTWHCFTVFIGRNREREERVYKRQQKIMFTIHFIATLILFLNSIDIKILFYYVCQLVLLIFMCKAYPFVYKGMSKLVLNNMLILLSIGFIMIERLGGDDIIRQMIFVAAAGFAGLFIPVLIEKFSYFDRFGAFYAIIGIILLSLVFVIGKEKNGSRNWIIVGHFALQPSEFVKIIFVFFAASMLAKAKTFADIVKISIPAAIHVLILIAEKDLGGALIFYITYIVILYVATRKERYILLGAGVLAAGSVMAYKLFNHVRVRVAAWKNPWSDVANKGYQITQSLFAIGTGGWFGMGLCEGTPQKIPVSKTDFIFSAICEEMGVFFGLCIILVEISCFVMFINISLKINSRFYKLTALGLSVEYMFQVFLTLGGVTKFIPSTGVTLPLISYGGSSVTSTMILFAIIQGLYVKNSERGENSETDAKKQGRREQWKTQRIRKEENSIRYKRT